MTNPTETAIGNPKGKLLEFCARAKVLPPTVAVERSGDRWGIAMTLVVHGRTLESSMRWANGRIGAEQLASAELLEQLAATSEGEPGEFVSEEEETQLRLENPKGKLLERCTALRLSPVFDVRPVLASDGNGFEASASVTLANGDELWSDIRRARSAKTAEQAAAASLLPQVLAASASPSTPPASGMDARSALNELRMRGALRDYGFVLESIDGPPHAPVFHMKAFALRTGAERVEVPSVAAASKKEAERLAAERLFAELHVARLSHRPFTAVRRRASK
jgi:dsRNA-specific ribonuclease